MVKITLRWLWIALAIVSEAQFVRAEVQITSRNRVAVVGDTLQLEIRSTGQNFELGTITSSPGLQVRNGGTSNSVQIIQGSVSQYVAYTLLISASQPGQYNLTIEATEDGTSVKSENIVFQFKEASGGRKWFTHATGPSGPLFEGEAFVIHFDIDYGTELAPISWKAPEHPDITSLADSVQAQQAPSVVSGPSGPMSRLRISQPYYALRAGHHEITNGSVDVEIQQSAIRRRFDPFGNFFGRQNSRSYPISPTTVEVIPLPPLPEDDQFLGMVGQLRPQVRLGKRSADAMEIMLTLAGTGTINTRRIEPWTVNGVTFYPGEPVIRHQLVEQNGATSVRVDVQLPITLVSTETTAERNIPVWFDPVAKEYRRVRFPTSIMQQVPKASGGSVKGPPVVGKNTTSPRTDIILASTKVPTPGSWRYSSWGLACFVLALAFFPGRKSKLRLAVDILGETGGKIDRATWETAYEKLQRAAPDHIRDEVIAILETELFGPEFHNPDARIQAVLAQAGHSQSGDSSPAADKLGRQI